jgi:hypothetical protein
MARRAGLLNGLAVFVLAVVLVAAVAAIAAGQADTDAVQANLRSLSIPTTGTEWGKVGTVAGIGSLVGALLGGVLGERWHSKLTRRAVSGKYRPDHADQPGERDRGNDLAKEGDQRQRRRDGDGNGATRADPQPPGRPADQP